MLIRPFTPERVRFGTSARFSTHENRRKRVLIDARISRHRPETDTYNRLQASCFAGNQRGRDARFGVGLASPYRCRSLPSASPVPRFSSLFGCRLPRTRCATAFVLRRQTDGDVVNRWRFVRRRYLDTIATAEWTGFHDRPLSAATGCCFSAARAFSNASLRSALVLNVMPPLCSICCFWHQDPVCRFSSRRSRIVSL